MRDPSASSGWGAERLLSSGRFEHYLGPPGPHPDLGCGAERYWWLPAGPPGLLLTSTCRPPGRRIGPFA